MPDPTQTTKMMAAIRIGCEAANEARLGCIYPECGCRSIPVAVKAAVEFAIRDAVKVVRHAD